MTDRPHVGSPTPGLDPSGVNARSWIEDDDLLRDEGALLGLTGADELPASKVEAVQAYYRAQGARNEATRQPVLAEHERLESRAAGLRERIGVLERRLAGRDTTESDAAAANGPSAGHGQPAANDPSSNLLRDGAGIVLAAAICVLTYFIVRALLGSAFAQPQLVALGVTLAGLFVVFAPVAMIFSRDEAHAAGSWAAELWKLRLIEFGMPALAAFFVVAWGQTTEATGLLREVAAFLFLTMLFLVGGRLLLSLLSRTGDELKRTKAERRRRRRERAHSAELIALRDRADAVDEQLAAVAERLVAIPTAEELDATREMKLALLQSEFELARAARDGRAPTETVVLPAYAGEENAA